MKKRLLLPFSLLCLAGMIVACTEQGGTSQQSQPSQPDSSINSESSESSVPSSPSSSSHSSSSSTNPPAPSSSEAPINYEVSITNAANLAEEWFASDGNRTLVLACNPGVVRQLIGKEIFVASSDESIVKVENNQVLVPVAPGKVTITVIYHNAYATCKVTVKGMTRPATIEEIAKGVAAKTITSSDKPVELFGTVTGIYGNTAIIQEGDYAMYVYNKNYDGIAVGDRAHLISTYTLYNGLVETSAVTIFEKSTKEAEAIVAKDYDETSFATLKAEDASRLINVTGIYSLGESLSKGGCAAQASSGAYRLSSVKIGEMNSYIFVNKYLEQSVMDAINAKLNEAEAESKKIEVVGGHVYVNSSYMDNLAISITSADQLILKDSDIVTLPTKVELEASADKAPVEETIKLTPKFTPSNTNRKGLSYASDNEAVATVSADGVVKGVSAGTANITATSTAEGCENVKATIKVTITAAEYITQPVDNEIYVMGLSQGNLAKRIYLNGEMDGFYFKTVEDKASAAQVKVEKQAGAENKYALKAGEKYLKIEVGGAYVNTVLSDEPFYLTWDPVKCAFYDTVTTCTNNKKNGDCYLGTSSSYITVSAANNQVFFAHLYPLGEPAPAYQLVGNGTESAPYNVADAIFLGETLDTTVLPCYIKGIVKDAGTDKGSYVQNIKLADSLGSDKELLVYTTNEGEGEALQNPQVGDTITINGFLMLYKGTLEISSTTVDGKKVYPVITAIKRAGDGSEANPFSVDEALAAIDNLGEAPNLRAFVSGVVKTPGTDKGNYYQNMYLLDANSGNEILVYSVNKGATDDLKEVHEGDIVTIDGFLLLYKGTKEISNATVDGQKIYPVITKIVLGAGDGSEANPFGVDEALAAIDNLGEAPNLRAFVKGVVKTPGTDKGNYYQNMYLQDEKSGNEILVYSVNKGATDDLKDIKAGDIVTIDGFLLLYNGTKEISNATVDGQKIYPVITAKIAGTEPEVPPTPAYTYVGEGTEAKPYTVEDALHAIDELGEAPNKRCYVQGVISDAGTDKGNYFSNVKIKDSKTNNEILVYSVNKGATDDLKEIAVGDTLTIDGFILNYNGTKEISNATVDGQKIYPVITAIEKAGSHHTPAYTYVGEGTEAKPYTVEDALQAIDELGEAPNKRCYVKGVVSDAGTDKGNYFSNVKLKDSTTNNEILVYSVNKGATDDLKEIAVGDTITIDGFILNYNGTKEISNATVDGQKVYPVITAKVAGGDPVVPPSPAYTYVGEGTEAKPYTVEDALQAIDELGEAPNKRCYVKGVVSDAGTDKGNYFSNVKIKDSTTNNEILVYSVNKGATDDLKEIAVGDTLTIDGFILSYNGTKEISNATVDGQKIYPVITAKVAGTPVNPDNPPAADEVTVKVTTTEILEGRGLTKSAGNVATVYTSVGLDKAEDADITISTTGEPNCGSFWGNNCEYRIYQAKNGNLIVTAKEGLTIVSVKLTFGVSNNGSLLLNGNAVSSNSVVEVNGSSIEFTVGNTGTGTTGQVKFTAFEVVYKAAQAAEEPGYKISFNSSHSEIYVYESGQDYTVAPVKTNSTLSRDEEGTITKWIEPEEATTLEPQVNFKVVYEDGYEVTADSIAITGEYNKIKIAETNKDQNYAIIRVTKIKSDLSITVTPTAVQAGAVDGFEVNFVLEHCTVKVYVGAKDANGSNLDTSNKYYTRSKDDPWGYSKDAAQFNFEIIPDAGYVFNDGLEWGTATELSSSAVNFISPTSSFNKIKKSANGGYTLTKVAGTLTITVSCTAA